MKIKTVDKDWTCDAGCCVEYWVDLYIDGDLLTLKFPTRVEALEYALRGFGYEVEHEYEG